MVDVQDQANQRAARRDRGDADLRLKLEEKLVKIHAVTPDGLIDE
jgi:hypothetical protein